MTIPEMSGVEGCQGRYARESAMRDSSKKGNSTLVRLRKVVGGMVGLERVARRRVERRCVWWPFRARSSCGMGVFWRRVSWSAVL